jgi:midasin
VVLDSVQDLVQRTWKAGKNEEFLARIMKYAQRRKWTSLLKAFHTALAKVVPSLAAAAQ